MIMVMERFVCYRVWEAETQISILRLGDFNMFSVSGETSPKPRVVGNKAYEHSNTGNAW